jgi:FAD/FMN-containing dehydrogenase
VTPETVLSFSPRSASEGAEIFRACGAAAAAGRAIRAGVVESPYRPADGIALPSSPSSIGDIAVSGAGETLALLDHGGMRGIEEISATDLLAVVGGGVTFAAFAGAVGGAGLYFPHEPDALTRDATIAELVMGAEAFDTDGRFGTLREYVLSLEIATPGGEIIRTGSRSVKDVTGYNIAGLVMGCGGRCGMIATATLRLLRPPGTRLAFLCSGSRSTLTALAGEIHRRHAPAFLELFPPADDPAGAASLVGELQSAASGREEALLENVSALAPHGLTVEKLDAGDLESFRRLPVRAIERMKGDERLMRASLGGASVSGRGGIRSRVSLFPSRFEFIFPAGSSAAPEVCAAVLAGTSGVVESIEIRGGRPYRKRLRRDEVAAVAGEGAPVESAAEGALDRGVYRVFDPRGIMVP